MTNCTTLATWSILASEWGFQFGEKIAISYSYLDQPMNHCCMLPTCTHGIILFSNECFADGMVLRFLHLNQRDLAGYTSPQLQCDGYECTTMLHNTRKMKCGNAVLDGRDHLPSLIRTQ